MSRTSAAMTAFVGVNVIPMDTERVLVNQTVLVEGGKITALGPVTKVPVPTRAMRVDGRGKYLIPGLTDMHHHLWGTVASGRSDIPSPSIMQDSLFRELAGGVTAVRFLEGNHQNRQRWLDVLPARATEVPTPHIYWPAPEILTSTRPDSVAAIVAAAKAAGYNFIVTPEITAPRADGFTSETLSPEARVIFDSTLAAARRVGLPVASHNHIITFDALLALGPAGGDFSHVTAAARDSFGWQRGPMGFQPMDVPITKLRALAAAMQRAGVWITPTLICQTGKGSPNVSPPSDIFDTVTIRFTKALQDAGVRLLLSGDDGWTVHDELLAMVRAGLTPFQALRTGTYNPAEYFGWLDSIGTVAVGKRADLVLLSGNPLADIRHTREPAGVMLAGRWLDRAELDRRLLTWKSSGYHNISRPEPQPWLVATLNSRGIFKAGGNSTTHPSELRTLAALVDSLAAVPPSDKRAYEPMMRRVAAELGALRTMLTPTQQERFDPIARVWLREHIRQGYRVAIPGVISRP